MTPHHKAMIEDGLPPELIMTAEERRAAWEANPPKAMPSYDPLLEAQRAMRERQKQEAAEQKRRDKELAAQKRKAAAPTIDTSGMRWDQRHGKWIQQEGEMRMTVTAYDKAGKRVARSCSSLPADANAESINARVLQAFKRGPSTFTVHIDGAGDWMRDSVGAIVQATPETAPAVADPVPVKKAKTKAPAANGPVKPGSKLETFVQMVSRKEGCTQAECAKAMGWASVSMHMRAKDAGLTLRKIKSAGITRYFKEE